MNTYQRLLLISDYLHKGDDFCNSGKWKEATRMYDKVLNIDPYNMDAISKNMTAIWNINFWSSVIDPYAHTFLKGVADSDIESKVKEIKIAMEENKLNERERQELESKSDVLRSLKDKLELEEIYLNEKLSFHEKGLALYELGKTWEALEMYDKALMADPNNIDILKSKLRIYSALSMPLIGEDLSGHSQSEIDKIFNKIKKYKAEKIKIENKILEIDPKLSIPF